MPRKKEPEKAFGQVPLAEKLKQGAVLGPVPAPEPPVAEPEPEPLAQLDRALGQKPKPVKRRRRRNADVRISASVEIPEAVRDRIQMTGRRQRAGTKRNLGLQFLYEVFIEAVDQAIAEQGVDFSGVEPGDHAEARRRVEATLISYGEDERD